MKKKYIKNEEDFVGRDGIYGRDGKEGPPGPKWIPEYSQYYSTVSKIYYADEYLDLSINAFTVGTFISPIGTTQFTITPGLYQVNFRVEMSGIFTIVFDTNGDYLLANALISGAGVNVLNISFLYAAPILTTIGLKLISQGTVTYAELTLIKLG